MYRYRGVAQWLFHADVDELIANTEGETKKTWFLDTVAKQVADASISAFQIKSALCDAGGKCGHIIRRGHEKLVMSTQHTDYYSVHMVTTSRLPMQTAKGMLSTFAASRIHSFVRNPSLLDTKYQIFIFVRTAACGARPFQIDVNTTAIPTRLRAFWRISEKRGIILTTSNVLAR